MDPSLYAKIFLYSVIILTCIYSATYSNKGYYEISKRNNSAFLFALMLSIVYAIWMGGRPVTYSGFGDTINYAHTYYLMENGNYDMSVVTKEKLWMEFMYWCSQLMDVSSFFTIVDIGYFGFTLWACKRFTSNNPLISLLFVFGAFSFYSYGINGIRNGLAGAIALVSFSYIIGKRIEFIIGIALAIIAINIHKSVVLPLGMAIISIFLIKEFKLAMIFWVLSIFISLIAGDFIANFFMGLGFDDRMTYLVSSGDEDLIIEHRFRWDFLLYSFMPILLGYYIVIKRDIQNRTFNFLLNTYTLSNAFWVMVIRAAYSNRFAYLSWFMYPLVLAYPLLKVDVWGEIQGRRLRQIMLAQIAFTWVLLTLL